MSRWLLDQPLGSLGAVATELGCGMGLVSLTLAHLGLRIEGTDRQPLALAFARRNAVVNELAGFSASVLDWRGTRGTPSALIVASDVVYDEGAPELLFALLQTAGLLSPGGRLLLGGPRARTELLDVLVALLCASGYAHAQEASQVEWEGRSETIDLHLLTRPG
jgi:predicted TPR repeat methyltransferase